MFRVLSCPRVACCFGAMSRFYSSGLDVRESAWLYRKALARMQALLLHRPQRMRSQLLEQQRARLLKPQQGRLALQVPYQLPHAALLRQHPR